MDNKKIDHKDIFMSGMLIVVAVFAFTNLFRLLLLEFGLKNILISILMLILGLILSYIVGWIMYKFGFKI